MKNFLSIILIILIVVMTVSVAFAAEGLNVHQFITVDDFANRDNDSEEGLSANRTVYICAFLFYLF